MRRRAAALFLSLRAWSVMQMCSLCSVRQLNSSVKAYCSLVTPSCPPWPTEFLPSPTPPPNVACSTPSNASPISLICAGAANARNQIRTVDTMSPDRSRLAFAFSLSCACIRVLESARVYLMSQLVLLLLINTISCLISSVQICWKSLKVRAAERYCETACWQVSSFCMIDSQTISQLSSERTGKCQQCSGSYGSINGPAVRPPISLSSRNISFRRLASKSDNSDLLPTPCLHSSTNCQSAATSPSSSLNPPLSPLPLPPQAMRLCSLFSSVAIRLPMNLRIFQATTLASLFGSSQSDSATYLSSPMAREGLGRCRQSGLGVLVGGGRGEALTSGQ